MAGQIRVAVFGATGRMGATVCAAVHSDPDLDLVAAVDPGGAGDALDQLTGNAGLPDLRITADAEALSTESVDVMVDFTHPDAARENAAWAASKGVHAVIGTSGLNEKAIDNLRGSFTKSNCLIVPNFAVGAVLMMRFAEMAAPFFDTAEVIEYHHDGKVDAPSGTAVNTVERMAAASGEWAPDPTTKENLANARGAKGAADIPVHAVRMRGMMAHQEVLLGTDGQTLSIRHDSYDRSSFMPGVVMAVKAIADLPGVTVGLDSVLGV